MARTNVLLIGSGAREHAIAWKLRQSPDLGELYVAPGNPGTAEVAENLPVEAADIPGLIACAKERRVGLTVVGPEDPLAEGIVDHFADFGLAAFGPTQEAARIESSKRAANDLTRRAGVPTGSSMVFRQYNAAREYLADHAYPLVVKADGLARGKGVSVCRTRQEAEDAIAAALVDKVFGEAGTTVLIEEFLTGREVSALALCDGERFVLLPMAQDHKPALDGDRGPMTGGMGTLT